MQFTILLLHSFRRPKKDKQWTADSDPQNWLLCHDFEEGELDEVGWRRFWAFVVLADGRSAAGEASRVHVWEEGP